MKLLLKSFVDFSLCCFLLVFLYVVCLFFSVFRYLMVVGLMTLSCCLDTKLCPTRDPVDCRLPGSSVHRIS